MAEDQKKTEYEGVLSYLDESGNEVELYPNVKTDSTLTQSNKAADAKAVGDKLTNLGTSVNGIKEGLSTVESIAKGANQCLSYESYEAMITALNAMDNTKLKKGQNIYIGTVGVPDLWIYSVEESSSSYTFTDDDTLANAVKENVAVQIGYYKVAQLETQKVDLSGYVTSDKVPFSFAIDESGNYGYKKEGADTVIPFKSLAGLTATNYVSWTGTDSGTITKKLTIPEGTTEVLILFSEWSMYNNITVSFSGDIMVSSSTVKTKQNLGLSGVAAAALISYFIQTNGQAGTISVKFKSTNVSAYFYAGAVGLY